MALRHKLAIDAINTQDLYALAEHYKIAVKEVIDENKNPYTDGACRLIAYQIAFAGNGDLPFREYYEQVSEYCLKRMNYDELGITEKVIDFNEPELPKAS